MGIWGPMKPLGISSTIESKGKDGKRKEKHIGNNNNRVKYFPLNMEHFDKLKFCFLIEVVFNGPLTLY